MSPVLLNCHSMGGGGGDPSDTHPNVTFAPTTAGALMPAGAMTIAGGSTYTPACTINGYLHR